MEAAEVTGETLSLKALRWSTMRSTSRPFPLFDLIIQSIFDNPFVIRDGK